MNPDSEVTITSLEELDERHKKELDFREAEFQATIQSAVNKKRAKKDVKKLRDEIVDRHEVEKSKFLFSDDDQIILSKLNLNEQKVEENEIENQAEKTEVTEVTQSDEPQKLSKAAKRRAKKAQEQKAADERIKNALKEGEERFLSGDLTPQMREKQDMQRLLSKLGFVMKDIASDGDCLYSALAHQLAKFGQKLSAKTLRIKCAGFIRENPHVFVPFLETDLDSYCNTLVNEVVWGGNIELLALSSCLRRRIRVLQSQMPNELLFGEEFDAASQLTVVYFRHMYSTGEHYNAVD